MDGRTHAPVFYAQGEEEEEVKKKKQAEKEAIQGEQKNTRLLANCIKQDRDFHKHVTESLEREDKNFKFIRCSAKESIGCI